MKTLDVRFRVFATLLFVVPVAALGQEAPSLYTCDEEPAAAADEATVNEVAEVVASWGETYGVTVPEATQQTLAAEYGCIRTALSQRLPDAHPDEFQEAGRETLVKYLDGFLERKSESLTELFVKRLGIGSLIQPKPRRYRAVIIATEPDGAMAALDGTPIPNKRCLATVGKHTLRATLQSYSPCQESIEVVAAEDPLEVECHLDPLP